LFLYLGDGTPAPRFVAYNITEQTWTVPTHAGSTAFSSGTVWCMAVMGDDLYIGGSSLTHLGSATNPMNNIVKYTPSTGTFTKLASGAGWGLGSLGSAYAIKPYLGSSILIGGDFQTLGDGTTSARGLIGWDGSAFFKPNLPDPNLAVNFAIRTIEVFDSFVYVGGVFSTINGTFVNRIARGNATAWYPATRDITVGLDSTGPVYKMGLVPGTIPPMLAVCGGAMFLGPPNPLAQPSSINMNYYMHLDPATMSLTRAYNSAAGLLGQYGVSGTCYSFSAVPNATNVNKTNVYIAGAFTQLNRDPNIAANRITRFDMIVS
jgi:hypothetical protein